MKETYGELPKELERFQENMINKNKSNVLFHNLYEITLTDLDGSEEHYFGSNVMTDYFYKGNGYNYTGTSYGDRYVFIGDGVDSSHQPSVDNHIMFHNLTSTFKANSDLNTTYPMRYNSSTGEMIYTKKIASSTYDYNITGITGPVVCNEIGYGTAYNQLFSHSKIYDVNGNEKTITKNINQTLKVELYWRIVINKSIYTTMWNNGIYGVIDPLWMLHKTAPSEVLYMSLERSCGPLINPSGMYSNTYSTNSNVTLFYNNDYSGYNNNGKVTINQDDSITFDNSRWRGNAIQYLMETSSFDYFSDIVICSNRAYTYDSQSNLSPYYAKGHDSYSNETNWVSQKCMLIKPYKMSTAEEIEAYIKTDYYWDTNLYQILGINTFVVKSGLVTDSVRKLQGYLPVLDMDIKNIYRYNYSTNDWDIEESFTNPKNNNYDKKWWMLQGTTWMKFPDNVSRYAFINVNPLYETVAVTAFKQSGITLCYATDTWWDVTSWESITNINSVPIALQHKKYYITNFGNHGNGDWPYIYYVNPVLEYQDGLHRITPSFEPTVDEQHIDAGTFYDTDRPQIIVSNDICEFYVQNEIHIRKPEENKTVHPIRYICDHITDYIPNGKDPYLFNIVYLNNGRMIIFNSYYGSKAVSFTTPRFFMVDLSLPADEICPAIEYIEIQSFTQTDNVQYPFVTLIGNKYIVFRSPVNHNGYECVIYNTETNTETLMSDKVSADISPVIGTNYMLIAAGGDFAHNTIYDVENNTIVATFDIPSDCTENGMFAFENWVYIKCIIGTTHAMYLYDYTQNSMRQITYPEEIDTYNYSGFMRYTDRSGQIYHDDRYNSAYINSNWSMNYNSRISYDDGICVMGVSGNASTWYVMIFSRKDPYKIIAQPLRNPDSDWSGSSYNTFKLKKVYGSYYLFSEQGRYSYGSGGSLNAYVYDIGRVVNSGQPINASSEGHYADWNCYIRNGMKDNYSLTTFIPYKTYVYEINTDDGSSSSSPDKVRKLPLEGFITHKIRFETKTCSAWNNPQLITLPQFSITVTNRL